LVLAVRNCLEEDVAAIAGGDGDDRVDGACSGAAGALACELSGGRMLLWTWARRQSRLPLARRGAIRGCAGTRRLFVVLGLRSRAVADAGQITCLEVLV
jgi:hypothetical protein